MSTENRGFSYWIIQRPSWLLHPLWAGLFASVSVVMWSPHAADASFNLFISALIHSFTSWADTRWMRQWQWFLQSCSIFGGALFHRIAWEMTGNDIWERQRGGMTCSRVAGRSRTKASVQTELLESHADEFQTLVVSQSNNYNARCSLMLCLHCGQTGHGK